MSINAHPGSFPECTPPRRYCTPPPRKKARKRKASKKTVVRSASVQITPQSQSVSSNVTFKLSQQHIAKAFVAVRDHCDKYHHRWYSAEDWHSILLANSNFLKTCKDAFTTKRLVRARNHEGSFGGEVFMRQYYKSNPHSVFVNLHGKKQGYFYLVISKDNKCPTPPTFDVFSISCYFPASNTTDDPCTSTGI